MGAVHDLIVRQGRDQARLTMDPALVDAAAAVLGVEEDRVGVTYTGFALTSLPHKRLPDAQPWEKRQQSVSLLIEPGSLPNASGGYTRYGVPYGSKARMILIYLQSEAIKSGSRKIALGPSMRQWMFRMGLSIGGKTYEQIRDQAARISACLLTFVWNNGKSVAFEKDVIVRGGFFIPSGNDDQQSLLQEEEFVILSETYFSELQKHAVPLSEQALAQINNNSLSIDLYVWLAYRLHAVKDQQHITWSALHDQFGSGYARLRDFRKRFLPALELALAVYPDAKVDVEDSGLVLYASRPPIAPRIYALKG